MSEAKFTKGPWTFEHGVYTPEDNYFSMISSHCGNVCHVWDKDDAHLIAAAPDLYEALEDVLGLIPLEFEESPMVAFAKAALDKARGEAV